MLTEAQLEKRQNNIGTSEGLHYGLSFDAYKAIDAVNASLLKKMPEKSDPAEIGEMRC